MVSFLWPKTISFSMDQFLGAQPVGNAAYFAFGDQIVSFDLIQKTMRWNLCIDSATCFGVYYSKAHGALISHGELLIS